MDIQLHHLSDADKEAFVEGFAAAAAMDFPHFDAERDAVRDEPWSRPWRQDHAQRQDAWQAVVLDRARGHAA